MGCGVGGSAGVYIWKGAIDILYIPQGERVSCMTVLFITPPRGQPHAVFRGSVAATALVLRCGFTV